MISYVTIGTNDVKASAIFWEKVLAPLGYKKFWEGEGIGFAIDGDANNIGSVWVMNPYNKEKAIPSNGTMIGFNAPNKQAVDDFHAAAIENGGTCEGKPGPREQYGPNFYVAYIRAPDGNKVSALYMTS